MALFVSKPRLNDLNLKLTENPHGVTTDDVGVNDKNFFHSIVRP
jgi:hypothetical protein